MFDFDTPVDRRSTRCAKWDAMQPRYGLDPADGIAMWVADMEFRAPPCAVEALQRTADHGVFGYYGDRDAYFASITGWMKRRHGWNVAEADVFATHGVLNGLAMCLQAFTEPGDGVIVFSPAYHMFAATIANNQRVLVESELVERDGRYEMDLDAAQAALTGRERMVIFCSPHNPGGRVWDKAEIEALCEFCARNDLVLVSDEIHHDLVMPGHRHTVTANAVPDAASRLVTLTSASKTFNLAGGSLGNAIVTDPAMKAKFGAVHSAASILPNMFGLVMTQAAYEDGDDWLDALLAYLDGNRKIFDARIAKIDCARSMALQATYLAWVDFAGTGHDEAEIVRRVEQGARIATNHGETFGQGGAGHLRFNLATPRAQVEEAADRVVAAFS